ncbi:conserved hypothetical protein [Methanocaldococcus sp. FS406-22]|nr:conserved hypothetical protein [Methanocaldococcus sp. FS406-22]
MYIFIFLGISFILGLYLIFIKLMGLRLIDYFPTFKENRLKMVFIILSVILAFLINWLIIENYSFLFEIIHPITLSMICSIVVYFLLRFLFLNDTSLSISEKRAFWIAVVLSTCLETLQIFKYISKYNPNLLIKVALLSVVLVIVFLVVGIVCEIRKNFKY